MLIHTECSLTCLASASKKFWGLGLVLTLSGLVLGLTLSGLGLMPSWSPGLRTYVQAWVDGHEHVGLGRRQPTRHSHHAVHVAVVEAPAAADHIAVDRQPTARAGAGDVRVGRTVGQGERRPADEAPRQVPARHPQHGMHCLLLLLLLAPSSPKGELSIVMSMSVSVCKRIFRTTCQIFTQFFAHDTYLTKLTHVGTG